jgi:hypothetical protein
MMEAAKRPVVSRGQEEGRQIGEEQEMYRTVKLFFDISNGGHMSLYICQNL